MTELDDPELDDCTTLVREARYRALARGGMRTMHLVYQLLDAGQREDAIDLLWRATMHIDRELAAIDGS